MGINVAAFNADGKSAQVLLNAVPDRCACCGEAGQPDHIYACYRTIGDRIVFAAFRCPISECRGIYIATYTFIQTTSGSYCALGTTALNKYGKTKTFPKAITDISELFCETYNQALIAEENQLDQICGPGYRKALEFLIKDYLTAFTFKGNPSKQEEVRKALLGQAIEKYIGDPKIKACAKRAAWLGNDETHYTRKWDDKDIQDLKMLINITANHIDTDIESARYLSEMPGN